VKFPLHPWYLIQQHSMCICFYRSCYLLYYISYKDHIKTFYVHLLLQKLLLTLLHFIQRPH